MTLYSTQYRIDKEHAAVQATKMVQAVVKLMILNYYYI